MHSPNSILYQSLNSSFELDVPFNFWFILTIWFNWNSCSSAVSEQPSKIHQTPTEMVENGNNLNPFPQISIHFRHEKWFETVGQFSVIKSVECVRFGAVLEQLQPKHRSDINNCYYKLNHSNYNQLEHFEFRGYSAVPVQFRDSTRAILVPEPTRLVNLIQFFKLKSKFESNYDLI